jgi:hypothetical protein
MDWTHLTLNVAHLQFLGNNQLNDRFSVTSGLNRSLSHVLNLQAFLIAKSVFF